MKFTFATFCFGERYYNQVNRFIGDIIESDYKTNLVVITDDPSKINNQEFVHTFNINDFNPNYLEYAKNYYDFDFSVKRYSLRAALSIGFTKIILVDCDMRVNPSFFNQEKILGAFDENCLSGPVTYNFNEQVHTNSELGRRLLEYEKYFNHEVDKDKLEVMPEDCIQYLSIDEDKFNSFLDTWDKCIEYKKEKGLRNIPAGNIDEMCFSALLNGIEIKNNAYKASNIIYAEHDKWY